MTPHLAAITRLVRRLAGFFDGIGQEATWRLTVLAQLQPPDYILSEPPRLCSFHNPEHQ
jgi:hypothetical protein